MIDDGRGAEIAVEAKTPEPERRVCPKMVDLIGPVFAERYIYRERLGGGGMGSVYRVSDRVVGNDVALKVLREGLKGCRRAVARFLHEMLVLRDIKHPNVVTIHDYCFSSAFPLFMVMDLLEGPSLRSVIDREFADPVSIDYVLLVLKMGIEVCSGLAAAHAADIVHRDIKPDNIVFDRSIAKVVDFGIAHFRDLPITEEGAFIGTPKYMSPEQVQGEKLSGRSDVYSLGITLYECLSEYPPFVDGDVAWKQVYSQPERLVDTVSGIPEEVSDVVMKCLAKDPADRYQSANDLREALFTAYREIKGCQSGEVCNLCNPCPFKKP